MIPQPRWPRSPCSMKRRRQESQARPDEGRAWFFKRNSETLLLGGLGRRHDVVVLGFRIEELAGSRDLRGGGVLVFLTGRDVLAAVDALGFVGAAGDGDGDVSLD